jgi:hypothetical protein
MKPLLITLALLSVLCGPTASTSESALPHAIEVLTNMTFSPSSACILPAESPAVLNSVLWNTQEVDAQLNIIHHVYSAMTSKTAETESSKKKNRKKNMPHQDAETAALSLGEHADMQALSKDEAFFDCSDKTPVNDDCGDNTNPILLSMVDHDEWNLFSDSEDCMSDMEYEEVMVNESSVFDTSYFTHPTYSEDLFQLSFRHHNLCPSY